MARTTRTNKHTGATERDGYHPSCCKACASAWKAATKAAYEARHG